MQENNETVNAVPAVPAEQQEADQPEKTVTLTQARFDEVINRAMGRAGREAKVAAAAAERKAADLQKLLEAQRANPDSDRLELEMELQRSKQAESELRAELQASRKTSAISKAMKSDYVDRDLAARLIAENVTYNSETKTWQSTDENGNPISLEEATKQFADAHPYLVRSPLKPGQNSTSSQSSSLSSNSEESLIRQALGSGYGSHMKLETVFGKNSSSILANCIALRSPSIYLQLKAKAKEKGLI